MESHCLCTTFLLHIVLFTAGITSYFIIAILGYYTYKTVIGNESYCSLWTDVPGRVSIFLISCYTAGICGCFPLPERWRLNCSPKPAALCKIKTWTKLINIHRDGWFATLARRDSDLKVPFSESPIIGPCVDGSQVCARKTLTYGATQSIKVPVSVNRTRRFHREVISSSSSDDGVGTLDNPSNDIAAHPNVPWSQLKFEGYSTSSSGIRNFENYTVHKTELSLFDSALFSSPRRSSRRKRCITDPISYDFYDGRTNASSEILQSYVCSEKFSVDSSSAETVEYPQNVNGQRIHNADEEAKMVNVGKPDSCQLHLFPENWNCGLDSSPVEELSQRGMNDDTDGNAYQHESSPENLQFHISL